MLNKNLVRIYFRTRLRAVFDYAGLTLAGCRVQRGEMNSSRKVMGFVWAWAAAKACEGWPGAQPMIWPVWFLVSTLVITSSITPFSSMTKVVR